MGECVTGKQHFQVVGCSARRCGLHAGQIKPNQNFQGAIILQAQTGFSENICNFFKTLI